MTIRHHSDQGKSFVNKGWKQGNVDQQQPVELQPLLRAY